MRPRRGEVVARRASREVGRDRLARLPEHDLSGGRRLLVARSPRARLLGLALLAGMPDGHALRLPGCRSLHTYGMRFEIDVLFLNRSGEVVCAAWGAGSSRILGCPGATAALECPAGQGRRWVGERMLSEAYAADPTKPWRRKVSAERARSSVTFSSRDCRASSQRSTA